MNTLWQKETLEEIKDIFDNVVGVKSIFLVGSVADDLIIKDFWSDIDLKIIVDTNFISKFYENINWLNNLGDVFEIYKNHINNYYTIRVCFNDFRSLDITFISIYNDDEIKNINIPKNYKLIKNTIPNIEDIINKIDTNSFNGVNKEFLLNFHNEFIHKARIAVTKVIRNDLLIAYHLCLDLARDCLVLQMNLRDKKFNTNIHRTGGFGNEIIKDLSINVNNGIDILEHIMGFGDIFYDLLNKLGIKNTNNDLLKKLINKAIKDSKITFDIR